MDWQPLALVALGGGLLGAVATWYRARLEKPKLQADADSTRTSIITASLSQVRELQEENDGLRSALGDCELSASKLAKLHEDAIRQLAVAAAENVALRARIPASLFAAVLANGTADLFEVLDDMSPLVLVLPEDDGRFTFVNRAFAEGLGRSPKEIISAGWRSLIDPSFLRSTLAVEAAAVGRCRTNQECLSAF